MKGLSCASVNNPIWILQICTQELLLNHKHYPAAHPRTLIHNILRLHILNNAKYRKVIWKSDEFIILLSGVESEFFRGFLLMSSREVFPHLRDLCLLGIYIQTLSSEKKLLGDHVYC